MGCSSSAPLPSKSPPESASDAAPKDAPSPHPSPQPLVPLTAAPASPKRSSKPASRTPSPARPLESPSDVSVPQSPVDAAAAPPPHDGENDGAVAPPVAPRPPPSFADLVSVVSVVASNLPARDVAALMQCSRALNDSLAADEGLWMRILVDAMAAGVPVAEAHALLSRFPALGTLVDAASAEWVEIDFAMTDAYVRRLCAMLRGNPALQTLQISHSGLTDAHLADLTVALTTQGQVAFVDISNNPRVDHSMLLQVASLKALGLARNHIGDDAVRSLAIALKTHGMLDTLILRENAIGDKGCEHLANILDSAERLTSLDLADNRISDTGALLIKQMVKRHASLTKVNLEENNISRSVLAEVGRGYLQPTVYTREKSKDFTD